MESFKAFLKLPAVRVSIVLGASLSTFWNVPFATAQVRSALDGTGTHVDINGAQIDISGGRLSGDRANLFHSFETFGLTADQIATFQVNEEIQNVLGRVVGGQASIIDGLIQVSGGDANLYLMNPAGLFFGANAQLNVPGDFTATTATGIGFNDQWFHAVGEVDYDSLAGSPSQFAFTGLPQTNNDDGFGSIVNTGTLSLDPAQHLMLLGGSVINTGTLHVPGGDITVMAIPNDNLVRINQDNMILSLEMATMDLDPVMGEHTVLPNPVAFSPLSLPELLTAAGPDAAAAVEVLQNGNIRLTGSNIEMTVTEGMAIASQVIDTSSAVPTPHPSAITVLGEAIAVIDADITTSGPNQGGMIHIGGSVQGQGPLPNADRVWVSADSHLEATALENGDGGSIIVWADQSTQFHGTIEAQGGHQSGDGGFVEISGKDVLAFQGTVDTTALNGETGTLLLDPKDIRIVDPEDETINTTETIIVFSDTPQDTVIASSIIEAATTDVILQAHNDIIIDDDIDTTTGGPTPSLTLQAGRKIDVNASIQLQEGDFSATINHEDADPNQRDAGVALFSLAPEARIEILGTGDISIDHGSFDSNPFNPVDGGEIVLAGDLITDSGDIALVGRGGASTDVSEGTGVTLFDATLQTNTGNITIDGTGGGTTDSSTISGFGVWIDSDSQIDVLSAGTLTINGVGGEGTTDNSGIQLDGTLVVNNGTLILDGSSGGFAGDEVASGSGIAITAGSQIDLSNSSATLTGTSGLASNDASVSGIDAFLKLTLDNSDITINGQHDQTSNGFHTGVRLSGGFVDGINDSALSINGAISQGDGIGVFIDDLSIHVPDIMMSGSSLSDTTDSMGVAIQNSLILADNDMMITGDRGITLLDSTIIADSNTLQLTANRLDIEDSTLAGNGILHIQPLAISSDISLVETPDSGTGLELDSHELASIGGEFTEIQIGHPEGTGTITATGDLFFPAPVLLQAPEADGHIDTSAASLTSNHLWGTGSIQLRAGGDFTVRDLSTDIAEVTGDSVIIEIIEGDDGTIEGDDGIIEGSDDGLGSIGENTITLEAGQGILIQGIVDVSNLDSFIGDGGSIVVAAGEAIQITEDGVLIASALADGGDASNGGQIELTAGTDILSSGLIQAASMNVDGDAGSGDSCT